MNKVIYTLLSVFIVSSFSFAKMQLQLPTEITGEKSKTFLNHDLESNLKLELPQHVTTPGGEFMKMWLVGIMADISFPMGDFGDVASIGFSGHAMIGYMIARSLLINLTIGYQTYGAKEEQEGFDYSASWVPLLVGLNYVFNPGKKFMPFIGFAVGLYFFSTTITIPSVTIPGFGTVGGGEETGSSTEIGIAPRAGFYYMLAATTMLAITLQYDVIFSEGSSTSALAAMVGAMFAFH
ncbi:MAG: hypothetical protein KJN64_06595 [Ignavibacteria bacterium]|nr:hypothetical protein [Ignavibacteria bacterium]MBT8381603.1 hypothetical protein [Ignavibacteria bacterium]MBT8391994.1 hypothetical protein [Ignavibacteria bacterium]NNJ53146.1 hypothetical protein [Ignavibacteriaceae bacterium]NNL21055.1 hypothetical protein [Ignavibacteriaceae bacterium]